MLFINILGSTKNLLFLCANSYIIFVLGCTDVKFAKITPTFLSNMTALDIFMDTPCEKADDFNKVTFNFICENITYNEHFAPYRRSGCNLILDYYTSYVCRYQVKKIFVKV